MSEINRDSDTQVGPSRIFELSWGFAHTAALVTALELGLFSEIDEGATTLSQLAVRTKASQRGLQALLQALQATGLVSCDSAGHYALADDAAAYLVTGKAGYLGDLRHAHRELNFLLWPTLTDAVRDGSPRQELFAAHADEMWGKIMPYLEALGHAAGSWIAQVLRDLVAPQPRILDVGCGYGASGRALVRAWRGCLVGLDRAEVARAAEERANAEGLADVTRYRATDILEPDAWGGPFDVVLLSNVLHGYCMDRAGELLSRARRSLSPDGVVVVQEIVPDEPTSNPQGAFFSLQMLLTSEGTAHDVATYTTLLDQAGFGPATVRRAPTGPGTLLTATPRGPS